VSGLRDAHRTTATAGHDSTVTNLLLIGTGVATAVPLALFAVGSRLLPLSTLGVVQYVGPTIQFLIGVFVFHEPFTHDRVVGFSCIWIALAIYMIDGLRRNHAALRLRSAT
jgi:chloramphenicol-sensitive protein RarD